MINKALEFAKDKHEGQFRKYTGEPYFNHCVAVSEAVKCFTSDPHIIASAVLHDTLEDTDTSFNELFNCFGHAIATTVKELSDKYTKEKYSSLNRKERKFLEACRFKDISKEAKLIKYFDIMDNSKTIFKHDVNFSKKYLKEKQFILSYSLADLEF